LKPDNENSPDSPETSGESLLQDCCIFSWQKKATNPDSYRDSFFALEKRNKTKKLGTDNGISF
jgi:hypothetical protein